MGALIAKFRKEKTTEQILEKLEDRIVEIVKYTHNTQEQQKRFVGNFLAISIGVYVIAFLVFYFVYFPPTWKERGIYSVPLLLFPFVIISLRKLFTWYFQRKLNKNSKRLEALRAEKKKILEEVMDKEKYKVAVGLLARFGDKSFATTKTNLINATPKIKTNNLNAAIATTAATSATGISTSLSAFGKNASNAASLQPNTLSVSTPRAGSGSALTSNLANTPIQSKYSLQPRQLSVVANPQQQQQHLLDQSQELRRRRTPFPVLALQNKGLLDRLVDVLVGDGPQDRFAMICKECYAHNGMALKDDFDYTPFRCAFCNALNPSRKKRLAAPPLAAGLSSSFSTSSHMLLERTESTDSSRTTSSTSSIDEETQLQPINSNSNTTTTTTISSTAEMQERDNAEEEPVQNSRSQNLDELSDGEQENVMENMVDADSQSSELNPSPSDNINREEN